MPALTLLQIVPKLVRGGVARATLDAAQAVIAAGGSAIVASPGGEVVPDLLRSRASHLELPYERHPLWARLILPGRLSGLLRREGVDIVQARSPASAWIAGTLARRLGVKWIATMHHPLAGRSGGYVARLQRRADALVAVSDYVAREAVDRLPTATDRVEVIAPGVNLDRFDPAAVRVERVIRMAKILRVPDGRHLILCPARLDEDQGQEILIEAMKRLDRDDVFCLFLGATDQPSAFEHHLEDAIEEAGLNGRVQIGPYVDDMPAAYMLSDVVVSTGGPRQGHSRATIEAQAMGRPVVAIEGGAAAETFLTGVTGWLAPSGDADQLANALATALFLGTDRRAEVARVAQAHVRGRYSLSGSNARLMQLYERLLA